MNNSSGVTVAWGVNGWQRPPTQSADAETLTLSRNFQKEMEQLDSEAWKCVIPSSAQIETIDLRFYDRPINPRVIDNNGGVDWNIYGALWAETRLTEFSGAINDSTAVGVNVSEYLPILDEARDFLATYDFVGLDRLIGNLTNELRRKEGIAIIGEASSDYEKALEDGFDTGRAGLYLEAANLQLEKGNYRDAIRLGLRALDLIQQARFEVIEIPKSLLLTLLLFAMKHAKKWSDR
jgi:hypothetical protein